MQLLQQLIQLRSKIGLFILFGLLFTASYTFADQSEQMKAIPTWEMMWGTPTDQIKDVIALSESERWMTITSGGIAPNKPSEVATAWVRIQLPSQLPRDYGMYIDGIYAQQMTMYIEGRVLREVNFDFPFDEQRSLFPISAEDGGNYVYLKLQTSMDRLGIHSQIELDHYDTLTHAFIFRDLQNIILGFGFLFIAVIMLICASFLKQSQRATWISLSLMILTLGTIFLTYSPFLYANFTRFGGIFLTIFDLSLAVFFTFVALFL